ncbi:type II restriction endonuclease [Luteimonas sp. MC1895]|uniref:type II restriction endonuclease n=1 Tax=Luteimonas sp. MC1895 TaxID=2819513 RepID=UPI0018F0B3C7|nr:type II restriction endonuclease [Luteimonas sp. MC1895]MBJ6978061.1 hypothetical protein [Luteimonas sp. MC1895]
MFLELTATWDWRVHGFLDYQGYVHPIDTDTKVISTVFERLSSPVIRTIAKRSGYVVELANQTTYPDFTLSVSDPAGQVLHRIALDVKTTYASNRMSFTLGGYNSFLVRPTKNILHHYDTYSEHWVLGFIYAQNPAFREYDLDSMPGNGEIACPYRDVTLFIRRKHEITGLRAGSGNTKNIGSVMTRNPAEFQTVMGPFSHFSRGKQACDRYWAGYPHYCGLIGSPQELHDHPDFASYI